MYILDAEEMKKDLKACQQMVALLKALKDYIGESNVCSPSEFIEVFGKVSLILLVFYQIS